MCLNKIFLTIVHDGTFAQRQWQIRVLRDIIIPRALNTACCAHPKAISLATMTRVEIIGQHKHGGINIEQRASPSGSLHQTPDMPLPLF